jgi:hypothetical protein
MKKGNLIFIALGLGALYYYFTRNKTMTNTAPIKAADKKPDVLPVVYKYPVGLKEGDLVKGTPEDVYYLTKGLAHPVTLKWFVYNVNDFSKVQRLDDYIIAALNKGETFD